MQLQISRVAGDAHHALDVPLAGPYKVAFQCRGMRVAQTEHISVVCPDCLMSAQRAQYEVLLTVVEDRLDIARRGVRYEPKLSEHRGKHVPGDGRLHDIRTIQAIDTAKQRSALDLPSAESW